MKKILILSTALALNALSGGATTAWEAQEGTARGIRSATRDVRDSVNDLRQELRDHGDRLTEALRAATGENSSYSDKQIEADKRITDANAMNDTQRLRQEFRAKAESGEFDPDPGICLIAGLFGGDGSGTTERSLGSTTAANALGSISGSDAAVQAGGTALAKSIVDDRLRYANSLGVPDSSVNAAALVINSTINDESENAKEALTRLVRNLVMPTPPKPVTASELRTPEGQARAAAQTVQMTRAAAAAESVAMVLNMRDDVGDTTDEWRAYIEDIAGYNRPVGERMSELQGIEIRTLRYYAPSEDALDTRNKMSEKGLAQVMVDQMALANRIAYLQLELDSRRAIVETQILSALNGN
ncbi:hypothetical protein ACEUZ9_004689 [Paracoccus litorisediminis]|uniref:hypothetical protein n=1 Tax=Paracoccus litorisediminis TaxID=2006130 RepID=UPI0037318C02